MLHLIHSSRLIRFNLIALLMLLLSGCFVGGMPEKVTPVKDFELDSYLGTWYEIARLDHSFERNLNQVTAEYTLREGGGIIVKNRGFNTQTQRWEEAVGKAFFVEDPNTAYLKVSFFGPFYSSYVVFGLDESYQYAFVSGFNTNFLWLLSRTPQVSDEVLQKFLTQAEAAGFDTSQLIYVEQP